MQKLKEDKKIKWTESYTDRTLYLKEQFESVVGKGVYRRWEGKEVGGSGRWYVIVSPAGVHEHKKAKFFAGVRRLPDSYPAGGKYFDTIKEAFEYAFETWGTPIPRNNTYYNAGDLKGISKRIKDWKKEKEKEKEKEASFSLFWIKQAMPPGIQKKGSVFFDLDMFIPYIEKVNEETRSKLDNEAAKTTLFGLFDSIVNTAAEKVFTDITQFVSGCLEVPISVTVVRECLYKCLGNIGESLTNMSGNYAIIRNLINNFIKELFLAKDPINYPYFCDEMLKKIYKDAFSVTNDVSIDIITSTILQNHKEKTKGVSSFGGSIESQENKMAWEMLRDIQGTEEMVTEENKKLFLKSALEIMIVDRDRKKKFIQSIVPDMGNLKNINDMNDIGEFEETILQANNIYMSNIKILSNYDFSQQIYEDNLGIGNITYKEFRELCFRDRNYAERYGLKVSDDGQRLKVISKKRLPCKFMVSYALEDSKCKMVAASLYKEGSSIGVQLDLSQDNLLNKNIMGLNKVEEYLCSLTGSELTREISKTADEIIRELSTLKSSLLSPSLFKASKGVKIKNIIESNMGGYPELVKDFFKGSSFFKKFLTSDTENVNVGDKRGVDWSQEGPRFGLFWAGQATSDGMFASDYVGDGLVDTIQKLFNNVESLHVPIYIIVNQIEKLNLDASHFQSLVGDIESYDSIDIYLLMKIIQDNNLQNVITKAQCIQLFSEYKNLVENKIAGGGDNSTSESDNTLSIIDSSLFEIRSYYGAGVKKSYLHNRDYVKMLISKNALKDKWKIDKNNPELYKSFLAKILPPNIFSSNMSVDEVEIAISEYFAKKENRETYQLPSFGTENYYKKILAFNIVYGKTIVELLSQGTDFVEKPETLEGKSDEEVDSIVGGASEYFNELNMGGKTPRDSKLLKALGIKVLEKEKFGFMKTPLNKKEIRFSDLGSTTKKSKSATFISKTDKTGEPEKNEKGELIFVPSGNITILDNPVMKNIIQSPSFGQFVDEVKERNENVYGGLSSHSLSQEQRNIYSKDVIKAKLLSEPEVVGNNIDEALNNIDSMLLHFPSDDNLHYKIVNYLKATVRNNTVFPWDLWVKTKSGNEIWYKHKNNEEFIKLYANYIADWVVRGKISIADLTKILNNADAAKDIFSFYEKIIGSRDEVLETGDSQVKVDESDNEEINNETVLLDEVEQLEPTEVVDDNVKNAKDKVDSLENLNVTSAAHLKTFKQLLDGTREAISFIEDENIKLELESKVKIKVDKVKEFEEKLKQDLAALMDEETAAEESDRKAKEEAAKIDFDDGQEAKSLPSVPEVDNLPPDDYDLPSEDFLPDDDYEEDLPEDSFDLYEDEVMPDDDDWPEGGQTSSSFNSRRVKKYSSLLRTAYLLSMKKEYLKANAINKYIKKELMNGSIHDKKIISESLKDLLNASVILQKAGNFKQANEINKLMKKYINLIKN